jgi:hypothetical protein
VTLFLPPRDRWSSLTFLSCRTIILSYPSKSSTPRKHDSSFLHHQYTATFMCFGTYVISYSCGHVTATPDVCLRDIDPHYRHEDAGCKITQPASRCVECFSRDLSPEQHLTTTVRFNPVPGHLDTGVEGAARSRLSGENSKQFNAIRRW